MCFHVLCRALSEGVKVEFQDGHALRGTTLPPNTAPGVRGGPPEFANQGGRSGPCWDQNFVSRWLKFSLRAPSVLAIGVHHFLAETSLMILFLRPCSRCIFKIWHAFCIVFVKDVMILDQKGNKTTLASETLPNCSRVIRKRLLISTTA